MSRPIEVRDGGGSGQVIVSSYASVFNEGYVIHGYTRGEDGETRAVTFEERVAPGAFSKSLAQAPDVVFRTEHSGPPLARTTNGTLTVTEDATGLRYEARLDRADPDVQSLIPKIRSGAYSESSFAFRCLQDRWSDDRTQREMVECDIHRGDVSAVTFGASPGTGRFMSMRNQGTLQERRAVAAAISAAGLAGPGADLFRASWSNQHGSSCATCDGTGKCPDCDGQGWSPDADGDDDAGQNAARRRSRIVIPPSRLDEFERQLRAHRERVGR